MATTDVVTNRARDVLTRSPLLRRALDHLKYTQGKHWEGATPYDQFVSLARAVRDAAVDRMIATQAAYVARGTKRVYYLSLEFLLGRLLRSNLINLGLFDETQRLITEAGGRLDDLLQVEPDPGLGNGGLGRLAACYLDSAATLSLPVYGYGIRYEHGIFEQKIRDGWQVEEPEYWLQYGSPWELVRPELAAKVRLFGRVEHGADANGRYCPRWVDSRTIIGVPFDIPIVGWGRGVVNILRLWSSRASRQLDLEAFGRGGYLEAVREKVHSETVSKVLYPPDQTEQGKLLRLVQQYFFVACTISDILRRFDRDHDDIHQLPDKVAVQLNDTHPALAVAELMRVLVDERALPWDRAWELTTATCGFTNHTLLPEAVETWPVQIFGSVLPRHMEIIYEVNARFLGNLELRWPGDNDRKRRMSLIQEDSPRSVRMANLAIVGSHSVNGVAELHSRLLRERLVPDFAELWPERFTNVTNGVTPRRWLIACNPELAGAITRRIGDGWLHDARCFADLAAHADDPEFQAEFRAIKQANKQRLADHVRRTLGVQLATDALFDVQVKRLHEYKRQLLSVLHLVMLYHELIDRPDGRRAPRVAIFAAKAAPSYLRAKVIIKLIHDVAAVVNRNPHVNGRLRVVFLPNYRVSLAELIIPAADLSEQISTAGMEASGTGNMKLAMNGALTIGTLDGANIEIRDAVGPENFFLFGLTAEEVAARRGHGESWRVYHENPAVRRALDAIADGEFSPGEPDLYRPIRDWLTTDGDPYMLLPDIESYAAAQRDVERLWTDQAAWTRAAILNVAGIGHFSSDRSVHEYAERIWHVEPVELDHPE